MKFRPTKNTATTTACTEKNTKGPLKQLSKPLRVFVQKYSPLIPIWYNLSEAFFFITFQLRRKIRSQGELKYDSFKQSNQSNKISNKIFLTCNAALRLELEPNTFSVTVKVFILSTEQTSISATVNSRLSKISTSLQDIRF